MRLSCNITNFLDCTGIQGQKQTNNLVCSQCSPNFSPSHKLLNIPKYLRLLPVPQLVFHSCLHLHQVKVMEVENSTMVIGEYDHFSIFMWQKGQRQILKITAPPYHISVCFHSLLTISCAFLGMRSAPLSTPSNRVASFSLSKLRSPWTAFLLQLFPARVLLNHRDSKGQICSFSFKKRVYFSHIFIYFFFTHNCKRPT